MYDPIFYSATLCMIILSLGHSIMHATMINLIKYMGDMGVISEISEK